VRREILKESAVNHLGGCCLLCGYNKCLRALHFHHINPHEKDFDISSKSTWYDIRDEIEKCVLLCANCHAEVHDGMVNHELLVELGER
jgi:5-methylcytosine-specific restriction endonuclease McrA